MNDPPTLRLPKRGLRSLGLVVLVHALIVWGLASGLARDIVKTVAPPTLWIDEPVEPSKIEPPKLDRPKPDLTAPAIPVIPAPEIQLERPPSPIAVAVQPDLDQAIEVDGRTASLADAASPATTAARPEALCAVMVPPTVPAVNWAGHATFRIHARLQAGHVSEVKVLSAGGGMDSRTRRLLQDAVQAALGAYQCRGNQGFEQEFVFHIQ